MLHWQHLDRVTSKRPMRKGHLCLVILTLVRSRLGVLFILNLNQFFNLKFNLKLTVNRVLFPLSTVSFGSGSGAAAAVLASSAISLTESTF